MNKGQRTEDGVIKVVGNGIRKQNRCQGITKSKGNQDKEQRIKNQRTKER